MDLLQGEMEIFDWLSQFASDEAMQSYGEFMDKIDVIVMGRGTYEKVLTFPTFPYTKKVYVLSKSIKDIPQRLTERAECWINSMIRGWE